MNSTLITVAVFCAIALIVAVVYLWVSGMFAERGRVIGQRLAPDHDSTSGPQLSAVGLQPLAAPRGLTGRIDHWFASLIKESGADISPETASLLSLTVGLFLGALLFLWSDDVFLGALGMLIGMLCVLSYFFVRRARRRRAMLELLPEAIDLLARAVKAGETLEQGLHLVGDHVHEPLGLEFRRSASHLGMGLSVDAAMRSLSRRVAVLEMQLLAATLIVQRRAGGNLPDTLQTLAKVVRDRLSYHRQFRAATAGRG